MGDRILLITFLVFGGGFTVLALLNLVAVWIAIPRAIAAAVHSEKKAEK